MDVRESDRVSGEASRAVAGAETVAVAERGSGTVLEAERSRTQGAASPGRPASSGAVRPRRRKTLLDWFFEVGILVKGIDGAFELIGGVLLLFAPGLLHTLLRGMSDFAAEDPTPVRMFIAHLVRGLDHDLSSMGPALLIFFLLSHGIVKLVLVYCLLRRFHRVYPWAIAVLTAFLAYQVYLIVLAPSIGMIALAILGAVIIVLVYKEYRELRAESAGEQQAGQDAREA